MFAIVVVVLLGASGDDEAQKERERFVGTWGVVEVVRDGKKDPEAVGPRTRYVFAVEGTYRDMAVTRWWARGPFGRSQAGSPRPWTGPQRAAMNLMGPSPRRPRPSAFIGYRAKS